MCGIFGSISDANTGVVDKFIRDSFMAGTVRGSDSSGLAVIEGGKDILWHKLPVDGCMFVTDRAASALITRAGIKGNIAIGHNRAATTGSVVLSNAHPFLAADEEGRELIGVHNGTLANWKSHKRSSNYAVDSEWALNHILEEGADAFEDFKGAYCFVWWDSADRENLNIALNSERPMHVAFCPKDNKMFYASEAGMLGWMLERNLVDFGNKIVRLTSNHWYKFPVAKPSEYTKVSLPQAKTTAITSSATAGSGYSGNSRSSSYDEHEWDAYGGYRGGNNYPTTTSYDHVSNVTSLLARVAKKVETITLEEREAAKNLGMLGQEADFEPLWWDKDDKCMYGSVLVGQGRELDGIIRDVPDFADSKMTEFKVRVLGVSNDSPIGTMAPIVICSKPHVRAAAIPVAPAAQSATAN